MKSFSNIVTILIFCFSIPGFVEASDCYNPFNFYLHVTKPHKPKIGIQTDSQGEKFCVLEPKQFKDIWESPYHTLLLKHTELNDTDLEFYKNAFLRYSEPLKMPLSISIPDNIASLKTIFYTIPKEGVSVYNWALLASGVGLNLFFETLNSYSKTQRDTAKTLSALAVEGAFILRYATIITNNDDTYSLRQTSFFCKKENDELKFFLIYSCKWPVYCGTQELNKKSCSDSIIFIKLKWQLDDQFNPVIFFWETKNDIDNQINYYKFCHKELTNNNIHCREQYAESPITFNARDIFKSTYVEQKPLLVDVWVNAYDGMSNLIATSSHLLLIGRCPLFEVLESTILQDSSSLSPPLPPSGLRILSY